MSVMNQHEMMQNAFVEAKDIMNQIFLAMGAPNDWQIRHMTFDELVAGLYKILGLWEGEYRDDVNITEDAILEGYTAYNRQLKKVIGNIQKLAEQTYTPGVNDQIITRGVYLDGDQKILGDPALIPENIKKGATIFGVQGAYQPEEIHVDPVDPGTEVERETAESIDILQGKFAYRNNLTKILGDLLSRMDQISEGDPKRADDTNLYVSPVGRRAVYNKNSELEVPLDEIAKLLNVDPSKIEDGYKILGIEGTHKCKEINKDTDGDGEPDINIPVSEDDAPWIDPDKVKPDDRNKPIYINDDTDGDDKPNINIDTDGDGKPDLNIDTNKDDKPDVNIDTDGDGKPDLNIDTDGDYKPDLNIDTDGDGKPDVNIDRDSDGKPDTNIDINGDGKAELNIMKPGDTMPSLNLDIDFDGKPELNIDTDGDGEPELNIDTNDDWIPDVNTDLNDDGKPDINKDTTGDGCADADIDGIDPSDPEMPKPYESDVNPEKEGKVPGTIPNFSMDDFDAEKLAKLDEKYPDLFESGESFNDFRVWKHGEVGTEPYPIYIQAFPNSRDPLQFYYTYNTGLNEKDEQSIEQRVMKKDNSSQAATDDYFNAYFGMNMVKNGNIITISYSGPQGSLEAASNTISSSYDIDITDPRFKKVFTDYEFTEEDIQEDYTRGYTHRGLRYGIFTDGLVSSRWKVSDQTIIDDGYEQHIPGQEGKQFGEHVWIEVPGADMMQTALMFGLGDNRLRCPGIGRGGAYSIDFDQARRCVETIKNNGFTSFVVKSGDGCTDGCLHEPDVWGPAVTRQEFTVDQVEELIEYLHEVVNVLDLDIVVEPSISNLNIVLKHKGFLSANLRKVMYDVLTWNFGGDRLGQSINDFNVRGNEVIQGGFYLEREQYYITDTVPLDEDWEFHAVMYQAKANEEIYYGTGGLVIVPWDYGHGEPQGGELIYDEGEEKPHPIYLDPIPFDNKGDIPGTLRVFTDIREKVASYGIEPNEKECALVEEDHEVDKIYVEIYPNSVAPLNAWWGYSSQENIHMWEERTFETVPAGHMPQPDMKKYYWLFRIAKTGSFIDVSVGVPDTKSNFGKILQPSGVGVDLLDEKWEGIWNWDPVDDTEEIEDPTQKGAPQFNIVETKHIYDLTAVHAPFNPLLKQILYFTPIEEYSGSFTITMGSGHWYGFIVEESTDNGATFSEKYNFIDEMVATHMEGVPLSITGDHVEFHVGNAYKIMTKECGAGMDFAYDFTADWNFKIGIIQDDNEPAPEPQMITVAKKGVYIGICVDGVTSSKWQFQDADFMKYTSKSGIIPHDYSKRVHDQLVWHDISKFLPQGKVHWVNDQTGIIKQTSGPTELNYLVKLVAFSQDFETYIELSEQIDNHELYYGNAGIIILPKQVLDETKTDDDPLETEDPDNEQGDDSGFNPEDIPHNVPGTIRWWDDIDLQKDYVNEEPTEKFNNIYIECCPNAIQPINFVYSYSSQEDDRVCEDMFDPNNERIKLSGGASQGYSDDFKNLFFGMEMVKSGNIVTVSYSGPQTSEEDAENTSNTAYTIDLTDEKYQGAFDKGCHYGIYVDGVVSSHWKIVGEIGDAGTDHVVQNDKAFGVCVGGYAGVVENGCARDVYNHRNEYVADITKGAIFRRFRCAGKNGGTDNKVIDLNKAKQFLKDAAAKGLDRVCIVTGDRCIATCLKSEYKTSRWFNVNDEAGLIEYLTQIGEVLGDEVTDSDVSYSKRDLFIPGTISHSQEKRQRDSKIWNVPGKTLPAGLVKWQHEGSDIIQSGGPNELNYYLGKFMPIDKDWSFSVVLSEEVLKDDLYYGAAGVIIMPKVTDADNNGDTQPDTNVDTDDDGKPDVNIDTDGDGKPDVNIDTDGDGKPDVNIDTNDDGKPDVNVDTDGDGKPDVNVDTDGDGKPDKDKDSEHGDDDDTNDKKKIRPRDPDDHDGRDKEENAKDKDDRMENPYGDNDPVIDDLRDDIKQDPIDENNKDEDDNPIFDDEHDGDEPKDEEHQDLIEVEDEEGKKHYVPNPVLQWAYSDYYLPMIYPTTQIHNPEKYANPIELSRTVQQTYNVINDFFVFGANLSNSHARTYPHDGEYILWYDNNGNITEQYTHEQTIEYFSHYELAQIKNKLDQQIIQSSAGGNNVWIGGVSGSYQNWADDPGSGSCIYMDGEGKWHRSNGSEEFNAVYEKKNTRVDRTVTETLPAGQKTAIDSDEINAAMIPFVRYAIVQETRGKMYHYGNDTYLNLTALNKNLDAELPNIKSIAGSGSGAVPPNDVYDGYMTQWPNPQGMPPTIMEYRSDAYTQDDNGNAIEKPDYEYFQHNNYIEDALKCYKRFGKFFEKNGEMNSCSYKDLNGNSFTEAPTVTIDGESLLQIYVGDLKLTPSEVSTIWYVAFQDYNDYLPAFNGASCTTIDIQDTVYSYETTTQTETHTKPMDEIAITDAEYSASGKEILRFSPGQTVEHTNLTVTMNTRHWNSFTLYEHDESDNKTQIGSVAIQHNHINGPEGGEFDPFSMTLNDVTLEQNKTYSIVTSECAAGGTEKGKFVYTFNIADSANRPVQLQVEYVVSKQVRTKVPHQITRTIAEHAYCEFYPEDFRQECFQDIEDTFQEITQYVQENVGVQYQEHFVGNIFDRGSTYTPEEKKKIAKCIHDYLVVNNSYAYGDDMNQTLYPAMSRGKRHPVCASYSQAFKYCCSRYGIVCHVVMGICNPGGDLSDPYGGRHEWNRINYSSYSLQESQYLHNNGKIVSSEVSTPEVISKLIDTYDAENRKYYTKDNSGRTDKLFFKDPSFDGNKIDIAYIRSHSQYDKANWSDVDVTWDDPSEPGTDVVGNTSNISWSYFNVDSNYMKQDFSGSRVYTKQFITNMGNQGYANLVGQDSHQDQYPSGKTDKYYGSSLYKW